jgi:hypothetical protein
MRIATVLLLLSSIAYAQAPQAHLSDVHKLYAGPKWQPLFLEVHPQKIDGRKMDVPEGDCVNGYKTHIPGLLFVCKREDADAEFVSTGSMGQSNWTHSGTPQQTNCTTNAVGSSADTSCSSTGGGYNSGVETIATMNVTLRSIKSGGPLWSYSADNRANIGQAMGLGLSQSGATHVGGYEQAASRIYKQFKHDYEASANSR